MTSAANRYSRTGAPRKNPVVMTTGGTGEMRWKSRMPVSRTPPTEPEIWLAPMMTRMMP